MISIIAENIVVEDTVKADEHVHLLIKRIGDLVGCEVVCLVFGCSEQSLRHPLLDRIPVVDYQVIEGTASLNHVALLQHEGILAACDIAIQTGQVHTLTNCVVDVVSLHSLSVTIAPLERPAGVLGVILLVNAHPNMFSLGEHLLLKQYLPSIAQRMEAYGIKCVEEQAVQSLYRRNGYHQVSHEFMSIMAHELRSPLTAIKGYAALLQAYGYTTENLDKGETGDMSAARRREYLDIIMEQVRHLEVLIADMLEVSRIQSGHPTLHCTFFNCALLCQRTMQLVQQRTDQQHPGKYMFRSNFPPQPPFIWADSDRLQQVLTNLLDNAVKYTPDGGLIELSITVSALSNPEQIKPDQAQDPLLLQDSPQTPATLKISVQDWGIGIPQAQQKHLFEPFRRLANAASRDIPGVGLGLYITRRLVEIMSGTIKVSSVEGEGTKVMVQVPVAQSDHNAYLELTPLTLEQPLENKPVSLP
jgi:signal transduction histidine kinase